MQLADIQTMTNDDRPDLKNAPRRRRTPAPVVNRELPVATDAECGLLGCIILDARVAMQVAEEQITPDAFYDLRHRQIFETALDMAEKYQAIDSVTLIERLKGDGHLEDVGGIEYVTGLADAAPSAHNAEAYAEVLIEKRTLRRVIQVCSEAVGLAYEPGNEANEVLDGLERDVLGIAQDRVRGGSDIRELVNESMEAIETSYHGGMITGLRTGFPDFDKMTGGLQPGEMIVLAARPAVGKTALAMNVAERLVVEHSIPVGVLSLEMTARSLTKRLIASLARVNLRNIAGGFLAEREVPKLTAAAAKIRKCPLYIDDASTLSILQLKAKARRMFQRHGIRLLIVDYLQLVSSTAKRVENRQQEVADVSKGLKSLAKDLNIPVLVLSQLSRTLDKEKRQPVLADLKESGAIEQDADLVAFLHRGKRSKGDDDEDDDAPKGDLASVDLIVAKQRNGDTGTVHLHFIKQFTRFESAAKVQVEPDTRPQQETWHDKL